MKRKKILMWGGVLAVCVVMVVAAVLWQRKAAASKAEVEALGLRGTAKVSRPLSKTQIERLETHFLDIPPAGSKIGVNQTVNQVQAINKLNERQRQR